MSLTDRLAALIGEVPPADAAAVAAAEERHAGLLKPPGSLGVLERVGATLAGIAGVHPPPVPAEPAVVVCCGDHGVHAQGVTPWPQEITAQMVAQLCAGTAAIGPLAATVGARVSVVDVGVAGAIDDHPRLRRARVRAGTADLSMAVAMSSDEAVRAILAGAGVAEELVAAGVDLLVGGDMGIANTTPAACLIAAFTGVDAAAVTGPGAGSPPEVLTHKRAVVAGALERHQPDPADPLAVLAAVGGLEHAALVGVILTGAAEGVPVLLDGVSVDAAALAAAALCPPARDYLIAGHRSSEPGSRIALDHLGLRPLLDLDLRLGEGTGGVLAVPLVQAAARALRDMGALDDL